MYSEFITQLKTLRQNTARFRRVALHVHSPDSGKDWAHDKAADPVRNAPARFQDSTGRMAFVEELRQHLDFVAITDHMKCGYATDLSDHVGVDNQFMVLPGMEVNFRLPAPLVYARIHLVVVMPEGTSRERFARLFYGQRGIPDDSLRTGQEEVTDIDLCEWVARVHHEKGICIAAHLENSQGIRCRFRQTSRETLKLFTDGDGVELERLNDVPSNFKEYLFASGIDAVEIQKPSDSAHYRWISQADEKSRWIPTILTFDAHSVEELARTDRVTHIKTTTLGLEGLKQALSFPDTRIRYPSDLPSVPNLQLLGIQIRGSEHSFFQDVAIAFAENLNCLIGVRGAGKSTIVEALRYVFGYNRTLKELEDTKLNTAIREMQRANLAGCMMRVAYRTKTGDIRILTATFDEKSDYVTRVSAISGDSVEVHDVEASGEYPLRLFGWSEIETLGRNPVRQRDLLDRLIPELLPVLQRRANLRGELRANRGAMKKASEAVKAAYARDDHLIRRYSEFRADFEKLNTPDVRKLFAELDLARAKKRILIQVIRNTEAAVSRLNDSSPLRLQQEVEKILQGSSQELRSWWSDEEIMRLALKDIEIAGQKALDEAIERLRTFGQSVAERVKSVDGEIERLESDLRAQFATDDSMMRIADLRANAEQRLQRASTIRQEYENRWAELVSVLEERKRLGQELVRTQNEIAGIRMQYNSQVESTLNRFLPDDMRVSIDFRQGGDVEEYQRTLHSVFGAKGNRPKHVRSFLSQALKPIELAAAILERRLDQLVDSGITDEEFTREDLELCLERLGPFELDEHAGVEILTKEGGHLERLLDLQEVCWDDYETILLNGRPVNEKSPGQRSSAMLPLIALAETTPLVIDQPEDNLDKRLIGSVLMKVLAELKEKRQIIVCTHDPNILVGGDAEQVIVLEAESDRRGRVAQHGSIDNANIVETVLELLEGGAEAFEARRTRYGGRVGSIR